MMSKLNHYQVFENGIQIGDVFAADKIQALVLAKFKYPNKTLTVILREGEYKTKNSRSDS